MESKGGKQQIDWPAAVNTGLEVAKLAWQIYQFFQGKQSNSSSPSSTNGGVSTFEDPVDKIERVYPEARGMFDSFRIRKP
jgi:hypothetical protein